LEEHTASIFRAEYGEQDTNVKASGRPSNWLARNFELLRKQERNGRVDLTTHWLVVAQNETTGLSHNHQANQYTITA
jgi:hypothetical protein